MVKALSRTYGTEPEVLGKLRDSHRLVHVGRVCAEAKSLKTEALVVHVSGVTGEGGDDQQDFVPLRVFPCISS